MPVLCGDAAPVCAPLSFGEFVGEGIDGRCAEPAAAKVKNPTSKMSLFAKVVCLAVRNWLRQIVELLLLHPLPHHIFVVPAINEGVHLPIIPAAKQQPALHAFTEEDVAVFGKKRVFGALTPLPEQLPSVG